MGPTGGGTACRADGPRQTGSGTAQTARRGGRQAVRRSGRGPVRPGAVDGGRPGRRAVLRRRHTAAVAGRAVAAGPTGAVQRRRRRLPPGAVRPLRPGRGQRERKGRAGRPAPVDGPSGGTVGGARRVGRRPLVSGPVGRVTGPPASWPSGRRQSDRTDGRRGPAQFQLLRGHRPSVGVRPLDVCADRMALRNMRDSPMRGPDPDAVQRTDRWAIARVTDRLSGFF